MSDAPDQDQWPWAPRHKNETLAEKVERLAIITGDEWDNDESDDLFAEILESGDPAVIPLLLMMRTNENDPDISDERDQIVEAVRDWEPPEEFADEFIKIAGEMCRTSSPLVLSDLLQQLMWLDGHTDLLIERLDRLPPDDRRCLIDFIEGHRSRHEVFQQKANFTILLHHLKGHGADRPLVRQEVLMDEFVQSAGPMCGAEWEHWLLKDALEGILLSDEQTELLEARLNRLAAQDRQALAGFLENSGLRAEKTLQGNYEKVLNLLKKSAT